jgi:hypothetical protein
MAEPIALAALALEATIGWPGWLYARIGHPVGGFARVIAACERHWNHADTPERRRRALGVVTVLLLLLVAIGAGWAIEAAARRLPGGWLLVALAAFPGLAQRSLYLHVRPVATALARGDLQSARTAVGYIVGRDTARLDPPGVARAAIESLAESFCDGVVAPAGALGVQGDQHRRQSDRPSRAALARLWLGGRAHRRSAQPCPRPTFGRPAVLRGPRRLANRSARCRQARLAQCRLARSRHGGGARSSPRRPDHL